MKILENVLLAPYTTFKIGGPARFFCVVKNAIQAKQALLSAHEHKLPFFILGGGSNLLVSDQGYQGLVIKIENKGLEVLPDLFDSKVRISVASGESWDWFVKYAVEHNYWGIENLSHIPGSVGAIAVQNVGAYGQEAKNVIEAVEVLNTETAEISSLSGEQCQFGYRTSIFNTTHKGKYIIFSITFVLNTIPEPNLEYRDLQTKFYNLTPSLEEIRQAIIEIRDKKYPYPTESKNGNAGSFFKNLSLTDAEYESLLQKVEVAFGKVKALELESKKFVMPGGVKIPTAVLMDFCGLKDKKVGGAKINASQPLVIINETGTATAQNVLDLATLVTEALQNTLGVKISIEPNLLGF